MADEIGPSTQAKIGTLLHEITAGQHMDADTIEELRAHMEEKFLGYKQGLEAISDEDAFLLVREHFGKPEVIRAMYQETRERFSLPMLLRWSMVAVMAYDCCWCLEIWLGNGLARWLFVRSWELFGLRHEWPSKFVSNLMRIPEILISLSVVMLLFLVLRHWRRREEQGKRLWYQRLNLWQLAGIGFVFLILARLILERSRSFETYFSRFLMTFPSIPYQPHVGEDFISLIEVGLLSLNQMLKPIQFFILAWWFDRRPRHFNLPSGILLLPVFLSTDWVLSGKFAGILNGNGSKWFTFFNFESYFRFFSGLMWFPVVVYLAIITYAGVRRKALAAVRTTR